MKTQKIAEITQNLNKIKNFPTLDVALLIDTKVESDMEKVLSRIDQMESSLNSKYNVLLGLISFLGTVITVVSIIIGLKTL